MPSVTKKQSLTYEQYLNSLPPERREAIDRVWRLVRENVPGGYEEEVGPKFLSFKAGADWYVALADQKNYVSLYLMPLYVFPDLRAKFDAAAGNLKCGKSCINFKRAEDLPLDVIAEILAAHDAGEYTERMRRVRSEGKKSGEGKKKSEGKKKR